MFSVSAAVFLVGALLLLGIASSKFAARVGMPVLVLFLGVGMLAGSEGLGRIAFEDYELANSVGSVALALILFDGGLRTSLHSIRPAWRPALSLSTVGVLLTSGLTGVASTGNGPSVSSTDSSGFPVPPGRTYRWASCWRRQRTNSPLDWDRFSSCEAAMLSSSHSLMIRTRLLRAIGRRTMSQAQ